MKKALALALCAIICAVTLVSGTFAFFTDEETADNEFEVGYVDIVQHEEKRDDDNKLIDYDSGSKPKLYPLVDKQNGKDSTYPDGSFDNGAASVNLLNHERYGGYADKIVSIENVGKNAAYIRNIVAIPTGGSADEWLHAHFYDAKNGLNGGSADWECVQNGNPKAPSMARNTSSMYSIMWERMMEILPSVPPPQAISSPAISPFPSCLPPRRAVFFPLRRNAPLAGGFQGEPLPLAGVQGDSVPLRPPRPPRPQTFYPPPCCQCDKNVI